MAALSIDQLFDSIAIRVNGPRAWDEHLSVDWAFSDLGQTYRTTLENGVLVIDAHPGAGERRPDGIAHQTPVSRPIGRDRTHRNLNRW